MEAVAWLAGEEHSAYPTCVCPVVANFVRELNDGLPDDATRTRLLTPLLARLVGSCATPTMKRRRALLAADWVVRHLSPTELGAMGLHPEASRLRELAPVANATSALRALRTAHQVRVASGFVVPAAVLWALEEILRGDSVQAAHRAAEATTRWLSEPGAERRAATLAIDLVEQMLALRIAGTDAPDT